MAWCGAILRARLRARATARERKSEGKPRISARSATSCIPLHCQETHLGSSLNILVDLVVVGSREDGEVGQSVEGDGVRRGGVSGSNGVAGDGSSGDRVGRLGSEEETVTANNLSSTAVCQRFEFEGRRPTAQRLVAPRSETQWRQKLQLTASAVKVGPLKTSRRARVWSDGCL